MSGTAISALPAAGSVGTSDLLAKVTLGSPNVTQRATVAQLFAALTGQTIAGPIAVTNPGTTDSQVTTFAQFAPSAAANGYIKLPGGVTLQWGTGTTVLFSGFSTATITFPVAFSTSPWIVIPCIYVGTPGVLSGSSIETTVVSATTASVWSFNTSNLSAAVVGFMWFAIGPT